MVFLNPSYLWALLGIAVPIAIHLWSKKQGKTIKVGSIRFLQTSGSQKSKRLQLSEFWLLLFRILVLALLVIILAKPRWDSKAKKSSVTYLVEASLLSSTEVKKMIDSLNNTAEVRYLKAGFPNYQADILDTDSSETPHYWQLAKAMNNLRTDSIVVFTQGFQKGIHGKRPKISKDIRWLNLNLVNKETHSIAKIQKGNNIELISIESGAEYFSYAKKTLTSNDNLDNIPVYKTDTIKIYMSYEKAFQAEYYYIKSAFFALENYLDYPIDIQNISNLDKLKMNSKDILVWLSKKSAPNVQGKLIIFQENSFARALLVKGDSPNIYQLTQNLNSENTIDKNLAEKLLDILNLYPEIDSLAKTYDHKVMNLEYFKPNFSLSSEADQINNIKNYSTYLWIILFLLLGLERIIARYRKQ